MAGEQSDSGSGRFALQLLQINSMYGSVGTDAAHSRLRLGPLLTRLSTFLDSKPPVPSVYSYSFPGCRVDIPCFQISFTNFYETTSRPPCGYGSSGIARRRVRDMAKPAQPSLNEQGEHGSYFRLW